MANPREPEFGDIATEIVELEYSDLAHPHLELQVINQGSQEYRLPFLRHCMPLDEENAGFPAGSSWLAQLKGDGVELLNPQQSGQVIALSAGESAELQGARVFLLDVRRPPIGSLHGVSAPFAGRVWPLADQQTWVGRKGKRPNHIEIAHPTVSRSHATLWPDSSGRVQLLAEAAGPPTLLNGHELKTGQTARLNHGDLVGFGGLLFRFMTLADPTSLDSRFTLRTLGGFSMQLGGKDFTTGLRNEKARWLLGALGARWGESRPVEWLLGQFWPETSASRGRKNLGYTLGQIRDALEIDEQNFETLVLRNQTSVGLNPARLDFHDYSEVLRLTDLAQPLASRAALDRLVALYQGPFLADCYEEWAEIARRNLEKGLVRTLLHSAQHFAGSGDLDGIEVAFDKIIQVDPMCEEAALVMMEAALAAGKPEKVVATYHRVQQALKPYEVEPSTDLLKLFYRANLGI
jgi:DNA-binding SARP family transcriptional activator